MIRRRIAVLLLLALICCVLAAPSAQSGAANYRQTINDSRDKTLETSDYWGRLVNDVSRNGAITFFLLATATLFFPLGLAYATVVKIALGVMALTGVIHTTTYEIDDEPENAAAMISTVQDAVASGKIEQLEAEGAKLMDDMKTAGVVTPEKRPAWLQHLSDEVQKAGYQGSPDVIFA